MKMAQHTRLAACAVPKSLPGSQVEILTIMYATHPTDIIFAVFAILTE
tara:strand:- start:464 stop:607 length:144 start_codon:yes stop_codon:yes gene_type:complete